jgi:glucans biosynthesis protein
MHGGARGSGAPSGNQNAFKHGAFARGAVAERNRIRTMIAKTRMLITEND